MSWSGLGIIHRHHHHHHHHHHQLIRRPLQWLSGAVQSYVDNYTQQDAQLSQRDRAAGCVIVFAKSKRLELGDNILRTL